MCLPTDCTTLPSTLLPRTVQVYFDKHFVKRQRECLSCTGGEERSERELLPELQPRGQRSQAPLENVRGVSGLVNEPIFSQLYWPPLAKKRKLKKKKERLSGYEFICMRISFVCWWSRGHLEAKTDAQKYFVNSGKCHLVLWLTNIGSCTGLMGRESTFLSFKCI